MKKDLEVRGKELSQRLTSMVHEGHYRKVIVQNEDGTPLFEFPLLLGIVVTLILPIVVGFVLLLFLMSGWHAIVQKRK
jgi:hypothetical protein